MLSEGLTPIGLSDPASTMESFQDAGNEMLVRLRNVITSPSAEKILRTWGIVEAAKMIGVSAPTLRKLETAGSALGEPERDDNKRRVYSLNRINKLRNLLNTAYKRPAGSSAFVMAVANFKGGSAKTTTTIHLAQKCALSGLRVLLIDFDPQGSSTFVCGGIVPDLELDYEDTIYASLIEEPEDIKRVIRHTHFDQLDIVPGNLALQDLELSLPSKNVNNADRLGSPAGRLSIALKCVADDYDIILIDCGPNLGVLTINALIAADGLLIPIPPNMFDYASFIMLTGTLRNLFKSLGGENGPKQYEFFRILLSKHTGSNESMQVENMIRTQFGGYVLTNHMCATVEIEKATNDLGTVYDISKPRGSREAYHRALHHLNAVNSEIIAHIKQIWAKQAKHSTNATAIPEEMETL